MNNNTTFYNEEFLRVVPKILISAYFNILYIIAEYLDIKAKYLDIIVEYLDIISLDDVE